MVTEDRGTGGAEQAPKPAMGSSTIMVIFLGPPVGKQTGAEESTDRTNGIREREQPRMSFSFFYLAEMGT